MYPDHDKHAGMVPVTTINLGIVWCHNCRAWRVHVHVLTTEADEVTTVPMLASYDLGPFDDGASVMAFALDRLEQALSAPGGPWFRA